MRMEETGIIMNYDKCQTEDVVIEGDNGVLQDIDRISYKMRENHMICTIVLVPKKE